MSRFLEMIIEEKKQEVDRLKRRLERNPDALTCSDGITQIGRFREALQKPNAIIAEIKRASPAKGRLALIEKPIELATRYVEGGTSAISVLTDERHFNGSLSDLRAVSNSVTERCPILRKDFIVDLIQLNEARYYGANAVLLIVSVLGDSLSSFIAAASQLGLDALVEVHTEDELEQSLEAGAQIIGVNNRDLTTLHVDSGTSLRLIDRIPESIIAVSESGIATVAQAHAMFEAGFNAVLIGEALVRASDPSGFIRSIRSVGHE